MRFDTLITCSLYSIYGSVNICLIPACRIIQNVQSTDLKPFNDEKKKGPQDLPSGW